MYIDVSCENRVKKNVPRKQYKSTIINNHLSMFSKVVMQVNNRVFVCVHEHYFKHFRKTKIEFEKHGCDDKCAHTHKANI